MRAIILAAGRGSRMQGLTERHPKCLLRLRGRTLLEWQLAALRAAGIARIGIVTGYRAETLAGCGLATFHNPRWAETNMLASLATAAAWLEAEPCIVSYSDIFYEVGAVRALCAAPDDLAITYDPHWLGLWQRRFADPLEDAETFRLDRDGRLAEIGLRPSTLDEIEGQYMGLLRFTPAGWAEVCRMHAELPVAARNRIAMTAMLQRVIEAGRMDVAAIAYVGDWGEVDSPGDLALYEQTACAPSTRP